MAQAAQKKMLESIKSSRASQAYTDLTITCGTEMYKVHKIIVCPRVEFFARALSFGGQETANNTIDLPDDDPAIIACLIEYLYEGDYDHLSVEAESDTTPKGLFPSTATPSKKGAPRVAPALAVVSCPPHACANDPYEIYYCQKVLCAHHTCHGGGCCSNFVCKQCPPVKGDAKQLLFHAKMYEIADRYNVVGLKDLAKDKFSAACRIFWNDTEFATAAHHAFSTTPEHDKGMRDIVSKTISDHMQDVVNKPEIEVLLTEFNGLAYGLLKMNSQACGR